MGLPQLIEDGITHGTVTLQIDPARSNEIPRPGTNAVS